MQETQNKNKELEESLSKINEEKSFLISENQKLKESSIPSSDNEDNNSNSNNSNNNANYNNSATYTATSNQNNSTTQMVWVGKTGTKYHRQSCPTLKGKGIQITYEQAISQNRQPCKVCY